jgi:hypothetical protein
MMATRLGKAQVYTMGRKVYLESTIAYGRKCKRIYVAVGKEDRDFLVNDFSPFLAPVLMVALHKGEDVYIDGSVSKRLLENVTKIMDLLIGWGWSERRIRITAKEIKEDEYKGKGVGVFFSGGVDSFTTFLKRKNGKNPVDTFIFVKGFDVKVDDYELNKIIVSKLRGVARLEKVRLVVVETNVRELLDPRLEWDYSHGAAMAMVALALRKRLKRVFFSGGMEIEAIRPYGIHYEFDPLWSTETLRFFHEGKHERRIDKVHMYIAKSPTALRTLRVCWKNPFGKYNCGECEKCIRTMLSLYTAGVLGKCSTFPRKIDPRVVRKIFLEKNQVRYYQENLDLLIDQERGSRLSLAVAEAIRRSERQSELARLTRRMRQEVAQIDAKYLSGQLYRIASRNGLV